MKEHVKGSRFSQLLKWMGYAAAILSFLGTLYGLGRFAYDRADTNRKINALLASEAVQLQGHDYDSAWRTLEQAQHLKPDSGKVHAAQESLAILWLDDFELQRTEKFAAISQKLVPVLTRMIAVTKQGTQRADLLARLGWAYYLQFRENASEVDPETTFKQAVDDDANNPYAHAMWGYFLLWSKYREDYLESARKHFAAALASQRERNYVRLLQTVGLSDCRTDVCMDELLRVASEIRRDHGQMPDHPRLELFGQYYFEFGGGSQSPQRFINLLPPAEHLATFHWLFDEIRFDRSKADQRTFYTAILQEAAGDREGALANYRLCIANDRPNSGSMWERATAAIKRLSR